MPDEKYRDPYKEVARLIEERDHFENEFVRVDQENAHLETVVSGMYPPVDHEEMIDLKREIDRLTGQVSQANKCYAKAQDENEKLRAQLTSCKQFKDQYAEERDHVNSRLREVVAENEKLKQELEVARIDTSRIKQLIGLGWKHDEKGVTTFQGFLNWFSRLVDNDRTLRAEVARLTEEKEKLKRQTKDRPTTPHQPGDGKEIER